LGRGQCVEQYGAGEAFMPLLEIAGQLCRGPGVDHIRDVLRQYAPSWLVQLPFLIDANELESLQRQLLGSTRGRMLREAAELMTVFTREQGLVLILEDLHWSDVSTLEWLSYIAQRREPAKLLIIGTYRPTEVLANNHPLRGVVQELTARGRCEALRIMPLSEQAVRDYLGARLGDTLAASSLPNLIHRRTGGNPLFVVNVINDLLQQGLVRKEAGHWQIKEEPLNVSARVPNTLRQVIERQIERLPAEVQHLLEVASVVGVEFSAAAVAAGMQAAVEEIDQQCETLARREHFIAAHGTEEWPDGTFSEHYSFRHALYHAVLYDRLTETQRVRLHRRIAERKEAAYSERASEIAAELATHFEKGRDGRRAIYHLQRAGENALHRYANQEAISYLTKGLESLKTLPNSPNFFRQELSLLVALGPALIATKGYAASEVERVYRRAQEICQQIEDPSALFPVLFGLWNYYVTRADQRPTRDLAEQMLTLARRLNDPALLLQAHRALTETFFWMGEFPTAREHGEQGIALYDPQQHYSHAVLYAEEPGAYCCAITAWVLWYLGYPEQALRKGTEALALARQGSHPFSEAMALTLVTQVLLLRGEIHVAQAHAKEGIELATAQGFPFWETWDTILHGWTRAQLGQGKEGAAEIHNALALYPAVEFRTWNLALLAEASEKAGAVDEGLRVLTEALAMVEQTGERFYEAELYRLKGQLMLQSQTGLGQVLSSSQTSQDKSENSKSQSLNPAVQVDAEACFHKALTVARQQAAKSWELRAASSLARLWQSQGKITEARELLADVYGWFSEGFDTADLREAETLLVTLGGVKTREDSQKSTRKNTEHAEGLSLKAEGQPSFSAEGLQPAAYSLLDPAPIPSTQPLTSNTFRSEGEYWTVTFAGKTCRIRDTLGMRYLAQLLAHPHEEMHVLTLAAEELVAPPDSPASDKPTVPMHTEFSDAGEVLDPQARAAYRQRLQDLQEELAEAQSFHDEGRVEKLQDEIEFLTHELTQAVGLGGRTRKAASVAERARVNVTKRIKIALRRIGEQHPALGEYLAQTVRTGTFCEYVPLPQQPVTWES
jgi:predicted ATPase